MINYPNKKVIKDFDEEVKKERTKERKIFSAANRGMDFEHAVNSSNDYYDSIERAVITKRPTPIKVVKVDYAHNARITEAHFEKQSTTDYNGVYKGKYIDFECKETKSLTALTFNNISLHQIKHLQKVLKHGGIAFFLIYFVNLSEVYLLDASYVIEKYLHQEERKSLPISYIKEYGHLIEQGYIPRLNYLDTVDQVYFK